MNRKKIDRYSNTYSSTAKHLKVSHHNKNIFAYMRFQTLELLALQKSLP